MKARKSCKVFARCKKDATTTIPNPILGKVDACKRCHDWYHGIKAKAVKP